eukprot:scaffold126666_cov31-Attheya_sp.AAC.1
MEEHRTVHASAKKRTQYNNLVAPLRSLAICCCGPLLLGRATMVTTQRPPLSLPCAAIAQCSCTAI